MFETIIASFLKGYVARYVDINADQLSVQLLYGRPIVVENLTFHKSALNNDIRTKLKLPIEIESLHVGKIQCSFVWSSLFFRSSSAAFIIQVENVRAIIKPIVLDDYDHPFGETFDDQNELDETIRKQNLLDLAEQQLEKEFEYLGEVKASSWGLKRLILSFLEKIQVEIRHVDITYQSFTSDNQPYQLGLAFDNIQIRNEFSNENANRKIFQIQNLGLYVDSNVDESPSISHQYILLPSNSIKIFLTHNYLRSSLKSRQQPRYEFQWTFDDLYLKSSVEQIRILSDVIRFIQYSNTHRSFITDPGRPQMKISRQSARHWWRYITLVLIRTQNYLKNPVGNDQTHSTTQFWFNGKILTKRLKQLVTYKRLYRSYLDQKHSKRPNPTGFPLDDRQTMKEIEMDFDLDCLLRIRRVIFRLRAKEQFSLFQHHQQQNQPASSWYMSYAKWISSKTVDLWKATPTPSTIPLNENDQKLQEQVSTFIAQSLEDEDLSQRRQDALYLRLKFVLKSVQIDLMDNDEAIFNFSLDNVSVLTELRPRHESVLLYIGLDDLNIRDRIRTDLFSNIVCPKQQRIQDAPISAQRAPVFEFSYETNPRDQQAKSKRLAFSIAMRSRGLCLVCCPQSAERLRDFFSSAFIERSSSTPSPSILQHWTQLKDRTTKQLKSAFEQIFSKTMTKMTATHVKKIKQGQRRHRKKFDIYLDICAPQVIIPQSSDRALIIDFGYLTFLNDEYRKSSCPLSNCDMHNSGSLSPSSTNDFFQQRPYFFNEQHSSPVPSTINDDENEEFLTPDSSPSANDGPFEPETINYPINTIPRDQSPSPGENESNFHYSSFSLSLCDMQLGYFQPGKNSLSSIIERFGVCFLIQYRTIETFDPLLPLIKVSGTLPKIIIHLDPSRLETLCGTIQNWGLFMENFSTSFVSQPDFSTPTNSRENLDRLNARFTLGFRINEISLQLSDDFRALTEIRVENIDFTLMNHIESNLISFSVHTLMIVDALQNHGKDYELLLTSHRALEINTQTGTLYESPKMSTKTEENYLIIVHIQSSSNAELNENSLNIDIHVNKLHFLFNPETLSILTNFLVDVFHRVKSIRRENVKESNRIRPTNVNQRLTRFQISSEFEELSILFTNVLTVKANGKRFPGRRLEKIAATRIRLASLNVSLEPTTYVKAEICSLQIFNLLNESMKISGDEKSCAIIDLGTDQQDEHFSLHGNSPSKAFQLFYSKKIEEENQQIVEDLFIQMASLCYTHSPKILFKIEQIFKYIAQNCHSSTAFEVEKMKQNMIRQGSILLNQYVIPNESMLQAEESTRQLNLSVTLATPILVFRPQSNSPQSNDRLVFHLGHIHVETAENHPSTYEITVKDVHLFSIDLTREFRQNPEIDLLRLYQKPNSPLPILDNISIQLTLKLTEISTRVDSQLVSSVQMFLGKHQITLLQNIISSLTYNEDEEFSLLEPADENDSLFEHEHTNLRTPSPRTTTSFKTFAIHFQLPELILAFQADLECKPTKVCEAIFGQFQMSIEQKDQFRKTISLRLDSLHINDHLIKQDRCLFSTRCRKKSSISPFAYEHVFSSSVPIENNSQRRRHHQSPSSVPAYMETNESSTWTLISNTSPRFSRASSTTAPAFIDINITLMDKRHADHQGFNIIADAQFGEVNIEFVISTWVMLFDIIGLIGGRPSPMALGTSENKELPPTSDTDFMQISVHIDAVSCLLHDDHIPPIRLSLQRFDCQLQNFVTIEKAMKTISIKGQLGSVSILDLSPFGQLYDERLRTTGTNALTFIYTKEENLIPIALSNFPSRLQLFLRLTSVQYIHTQRFLMDIIHFFDRFQHDQDCYNRIRSAAAGQVITCNAGRSTGIELDIEAESPILILPEYALNKPAIVLHLGHIIVKNRFLFDNEPGTLSAVMNRPTESKCLLDVISVQFEDSLLYSATYGKLDAHRKALVEFSNFGFYTTSDEYSFMLRKRASLSIQIERNLDSSLNHASPTYSIKADLSSVDILLDTSQYALFRGILAYNIGEQLEQPTRPAMMIEDPLCVSTVLTGDVYHDLMFIIQMNNVGFEIFTPTGSTRHSLAYCAFSQSNFSFEKLSNNNQVLHLTCSSIKLTDTRTENANRFREILSSSPSAATSQSPMQLEIHLSTSKTEEKYAIVLNHTRILFIVDWLLKLNDFLSSFQQQTISTSPTVSPSIVAPTKKVFEVRLNFHQSELFLVQTTSNEQSNALVLSGVMTLTYRESQPNRPLDCNLFAVTLFSCQMNDIQSTAVAIIEPVNINFNIHLTKEKQQRVFELNLPKLFIRLSYSDVKVMSYMFQSIQKQIDQAQSREVLPKSSIVLPRKLSIPFEPEFVLEYCPEENHHVDFRVRSAVASNVSLVRRGQSIEEPKDEKVATSFFNLHSIKFSCDQISLCLIDDCLNANIPLLNVTLAQMKLNLMEYEAYRFQQTDFQLNIDYYNRLLSGYEPFIESWPLQLTLKLSNASSSLTICSNHVLNVNYTKTMHQLFDLVKNNWLEDYNQTTDLAKETMYFRRPKPFEPYCFQNLVGPRVKFRTWISSQQRYDQYDHLVEYRETVSFTFPSESSTVKIKASKETTSTSSSSDRRLSIVIEGWEPLRPISIDRVGTFFRFAVPSDDRMQKTVLVFIDVIMTDSSMRSITIRSAIEVQNQLLTPIDLRLKYGSNTLKDISLESNEIVSLPLQYCPTLRQFQVRPKGFALNFCGEPINWMEIANENRRRQGDDDNENRITTENGSSPRHRDVNTTDRQSFFRTCSMSSNENVYFVCIQSKRTRLLGYKDHILSAYQLAIVSPLIVNNLLPCDLFFQIYPNPQKIRVNPYKSYREHQLDIGQAMDVLFATELYHMEKPLRIPSINDLSFMKYFHQRVSFYDSIGRMLSLDVSIVCSIRHRLKITVSVPYVLLNKSGIPLVFKQEGAGNEAAGQTHEHELARNREPLLFSFSDSEESHACVMKVGSGLHKSDDGFPLWSLRFNLERGSSYRQLHVRSPHGSPDWIYYIGIDVRQGKGRLRRTNFIFLSTRYMISNQCSYDLAIAQRHIVRAMLQTGEHNNAEQNCLNVLKHSNVPYHWPRSDLDQLLCVRVINHPKYRHVYWSGGFYIGRVNAFHINMRYDNNQCLILRAQVIERGGTFFVVFMDSNQMPAPLRIRNLSDVPIQYYQTETREELTYLRSFIQPHQSIDYAWDEMTLRQTITCSVMGGTVETYDLQKLGHGENLCYENHICLAMQQTFGEAKVSPQQTKYLGTKSRALHLANPFSLSQRPQLVIDYVQGRLVLAQREENKRSQLWRMTSSGILVHTGSSLPRDWSNKDDTSDDIRQASVLDIEEVSGPNIHSRNGPTPRFTRLTIRRFDPRRTLMQTWTFHDDGYLCMGKTQMCVQVLGELKENSEVILGPRLLNDKGESLPPAPTMYIRPQRRLKGSGLLSVRTYADGPTRVLEITDVKASNSFDNLKSEAAVATTTTTNETVPSPVYNLELRLEAGIGISIISSMGHESEELVYIILNDIHLKYKDTSEERSIEGSIGTIIISNQLLMTSTPCLLYATYMEDTQFHSAVSLQASLQKPSANYKQLYIFRYLIIGLNPITIQIDEVLLWKLLDFFTIDFQSSSSSSSSRSPKTLSGSTQKKLDNNNQTYDLDEGEYDTQRLLSLLTSTQATRIYFNDLSLSSLDLNLSVYCGNSRSLPLHLLNIKRRAPFPLIRFENAQIHLKSYEHVHIFNTYDFFLLALSTHYVNELKRQAFRILGSVDFLGNPLGLYNDLADGFVSLVDHGSVSGLVKNVAHGVADSTSKFAGTLSYGLGKLTLDEEHDHMREAIADNYRGSSLGHVFGGTVGLAVGVIGGLTSIITQPYKGVVEEGVGGLFKGVAKGIFGTVSKPMVGVLDFANGMALAVKEGARSSNVILRSRIRTVRCPTNIYGLLQPFTQIDAEGQSLLYQMNKDDLTERYISRFTLSQTPPNAPSKRRSELLNDDESILDRRVGRINAMITSQRVIIYRTDIDREESDYEVVTEYAFSSIARIVLLDDKLSRAYVRFELQQSSRRPTSLLSKGDNYGQYSTFRCDLHERATRLNRDIERAREMFEEEKFTYIPTDDHDVTDDNDDDIPDQPHTDTNANTN